VESLAKSLDLDVEELAPQNVATIAQLDRRLGRLEAFPLGVLRRFGRTDRFLSELVERLGVESKWPIARPTVTGTSIDDYWIDPTYPLIYAPADWRSLLGLAALGHEVAHPLWTEHRASASPAVATAIAAHVAGLGLDPGDAQALLGAWAPEGIWIAELACDAIATFLLGEAYPWQHLRHIIRSGSPPYEPTFRTDRGARLHPADLARLRLSGLVLGKLGLAVAPVEAEIELYLPARGETMSSAYRDSYPDTLLDSIATATTDLLDSLGVARAMSGPPTGVVRLFNDAWTEFRRDPAAYAAWESATMKRLKAP
jgi:hypothetical protein